MEGLEKTSGGPETREQTMNLQALDAGEGRRGCPSSSRRAFAEATGTAFLLMAIVGSGIMAERLMHGDAGLSLLVNSIATGAALFALIVAFGPISGAHINPAVTLSFAIRGRISRVEAAVYILAQIVGALVGVALTHLMFREPVFMASATLRGGAHQWLSECVATFGLVTVIWTTQSRGSLVVAPVVGCYIMSAYWFTSSTSFANPAVTVARAVTDSFSGIHPGSVTGFVIAQVVGAAVATAVASWLVASPVAEGLSPATRSREQFQKETA
jgi:glycerol uptake facilitator-like aquaporin